MGDKALYNSTREVFFRIVVCKSEVVVVLGGGVNAVADPELNLGGGGFSRPEGPSGEGTGGVSPPVGGGWGGPPPRKF